MFNVPVQLKYRYEENFNMQDGWIYVVGVTGQCGISYKKYCQLWWINMFVHNK